MTDEMNAIMEQYWAWLKEKTTIRDLDNWVEITTPHLDRHNDCLQIYARRSDGGYVISDGGYILDDLAMSGVNIDSDRRQAILDVTLNGFGVRRTGDSLEVYTTPDDFPLRKHNLLQAMLAVNDLFQLSSASSAGGLFLEDVQEWLDQAGVRHTPKVKFAGKSGYDYQFDFVIPRSQLHPERVVKAINRPNRDTALTFVFAWLDTRETRQVDTRAYAVLNDSGQSVSPNVLEAMTEYEVRPVPWSHRTNAVEELAA